ncbi:PhoH family protein [Rubritalea marina]|uniref:PhoH family protein n=1 Tax=Rubritalea marina TaxID=361055 RepID=UPI00036DCFC3|nr:PhoH family protein [Rubritalea marina]
MATSDQVQERIEYESAQFVHDLFANDCKNVVKMGQVLGLKVLSRDGWVLLQGAEEQVEKAKDALEDLEDALRVGGEISAKEFNTALKVVQGQMDTKVAKLGQVKIQGAAGRKPVSPRSAQQLAYLNAMDCHDVTFGLGPAGTGKTYLAMAKALAMLKEKQVHRIVLTRPAVEAGEALGFLPGDMQEKVAPYLRPLYDAMQDMLDPDLSKRYLEDGTVEIAPLAYMRGRTLANAFIILDEAQNTTPEQLYMLLTRIGEGSCCVVTGDQSQIDLKKGMRSGLSEAVQALKDIDGVSFIRFSATDVVRHPVVERIITAYDRVRGSENQ